MNKDQLVEFLRRYRIKPNFTYGQNFLIDDFVIDDIVDAAEVAKKDIVLEIGPGIGNLTRKLCERAGFVLSVEKDEKFLPILKEIKKDFPENFKYEFSDILGFDYSKVLASQQIYSGASKSLERGGRSGATLEGENTSKGFPLQGSFKVVANIPYYITGKILQMFMTAEHKPESITILTQKEVAENVVSRPGNLSILAISVQLYGQPKLVQKVLARSFFPAPKVDSAVLQISIPKKPLYKLTDEKKFFRVVKSCFAGKRKQLHNTLVNNLHLEKNKASEILQELKINPAARPQELSIENWIRLSEKI